MDSKFSYAELLRPVYRENGEANRPLTTNRREYWRSARSSRRSKPCAYQVHKSTNCRSARHAAGQGNQHIEEPPPHELPQIVRQRYLLRFATGRDQPDARPRRDHCGHGRGALVVAFIGEVTGRWYLLQMPGRRTLSDEEATACSRQRRTEHVALANLKDYGND